MKYFIVMLLMAAGPALAAQSDSTAWHYIEMVYFPGTAFKKQVVEIDAGDDPGGWFRDRKFVVDENGKEIKFKTAIDALNHLGAQGWELVVFYTDKREMITQNHYILKRKGDD